MKSEAAKERTKVIHELKTHPPYFAAVESGEKQFEIRKNDRGYQVGDTLMLYEYEPEAGRYTGNGVARQVTYIAQGVFGLPEDVCVMSLAGYEAARPAPADEEVREAASQLEAAIGEDGAAILYPADVVKLRTLIAAVSDEKEMK